MSVNQVDFTKEVHVSVGVSGNAPTLACFGGMFENTIMDMRFRPFLRPRRRGQDNTNQEQIRIAVEVNRPLLISDGFDQAAGALVEFYSMNIGMIPDTIFRDELTEHFLAVEDGVSNPDFVTDLFYHINCWMGIIDHFGFDAPYEPAFIQQMAPALRAIEVFGFCEQNTANNSLNDQVRVVGGKQYTFREYMAEWGYIRQRYCSFIKIFPY